MVKNYLTAMSTLNKFSNPFFNQALKIIINWHLIRSLIMFKAPQIRNIPGKAWQVTHLLIIARNLTSRSK